MIACWSLSSLNSLSDDLKYRLWYPELFEDEYIGVPFIEPFVDRDEDNEDNEESDEDNGEEACDEDNGIDSDDVAMVMLDEDDIDDMDDTEQLESLDMLWISSSAVIGANFTLGGDRGVKRSKS